MDLGGLSAFSQSRTLVFNAGERGTEMAVILEGTLASTYRTDSGVETFAEYREGEQVGELALLRDGPRASDVVAVTDVRVLAISKDVVEAPCWSNDLT